MSDFSKEKYRCAFVGHNGITISDLMVKPSNPNLWHPIHFSFGEYLQTDLLNPADLQKSRSAGALHKFIEMGWIVVENAAVSVEVKASSTKIEYPAQTAAITEVQAGTVAPKDITNLTVTAGRPSNMLDYPEDKPTKVIEVISDKESRTVNNFAILESAANDNGLQNDSEIYEKFSALRYFQKLKTIKETDNLKLLELIATKSNYPQLVHNSKSRLKELQVRK